MTQFSSYLSATEYKSKDILADWKWLLKTDYNVWGITKFGDALLSSGDGAIHWLNTADGTIKQIANNKAEFDAHCSIPQNFQDWFMPDVVDGQGLLGMVPGQDECLSFKIPPKLGGELDPDNIEVTDILVHFSIAGQLHRQIKDLPPGTKINDVVVNGLDETKSTKTSSEQGDGAEPPSSL